MPGGSRRGDLGAVIVANTQDATWRSRILLYGNEQFPLEDVIRQADRARADIAAIEGDLDLVKVQLSRITTGKELWASV